MRVWGTLEEARQAGRRRVTQTEKFHGYSDILFETPPEVMAGPQAFLVHQAPDWTLSPHFHREDQFQLVVRGSGILGAHEISPYSIHFSAEETGYGPIVSGSEGLDYFTLRAVSDHGVFFLPENRHRMQPGLPRRQFTAHIQQGAMPGSQDGGSVGTRVVIPRKEDGLAAWATLAASGQAASAPPDIAGVGRMHVVINGGFAMGEVHLPRLACVFTSPDEPALKVTALADNAEFLALSNGV